MAKVEKIIEKMKSQPNGIRMSEIELVLKHYEYVEIRQKGSHRHFSNGSDLITIKVENPLKVAYVKDVLKRIGQ